MAAGELELVEWLRGALRANPLRVPIGIGDDMAAVRVSGNVVLVTADLLMDGVDFRVGEHSPEQIGRKALAASLSDCAAMAAVPIAAVVSVALPASWSVEQARALYEGMRPLTERYACPIVGGDTNSWGHPLVIDVTVLGQVPPLGRVARRDGAKAGDGIYVSGPLGGSLGGRHLTFEPRVTEARALAAGLGERLHAMMDISDGLSLDLSRMCAASGVGAELDAAALSKWAIHPDAESAARADGRSALSHALVDGEDFELLAAVGEAASGEEVLEVAGHRWFRVGRFVAGAGLSLLHGEGRREVIEPRGWEHRFGDAAGGGAGR